MRAMTRLAVLLFLAPLGGCGGDEAGSGDSDTGGTLVVVPTIVFKTAVNAQGIEGEVGADALDQHRVVNTVQSAIQLALAEEQVVARLQVDNGSVRSNHCWSAPPVAQTNFTIDYSGCEDDGMTGGIFIDDTPQGPVVIEFLNFTFDDERTITGAVALDSNGTDDTLEWALYDTVSSAPSPTSPSPVGVEIDGASFFFGITGGGDLDLQFNSWAQWGVTTVTSLSGEGTVLAGGTVSDDLLGSDKPSQSMAGPLSWTSCRCPYVGTQVFDFGLDISTVLVDLDKLEEEDDDEDDPEMSFGKDVVVEGMAELTTIGCGDYEVVFTADSEPTVVVQGAEIRSEIQRLCDIALLEGPKCQGFLDASDQVSEITVTIGAAKMQAAAEETVRNDFDTGFCRVGE
jgi:hypothetical protein